MAGGSAAEAAATAAAASFSSSDISAGMCQVLVFMHGVVVLAFSCVCILHAAVCTGNNDLVLTQGALFNYDLWFVPCTMFPGAGSPAERDLTRAPLNVSPPQAVSERPGRANATCGACGYQKTTEFGKTHYFPNCTMVVDNVQCVASLPKGHVFYTGAKCNTLKCPCKDAYVLLFCTLFCPLWVSAFLMCVDWI